MGCAAIALGLAVGALDVYLLVTIGAYYGTANVLLFVVLSAIVGTQLAVRQGKRFVRRMSLEELTATHPAVLFIEGILIMAAGLLMVFPGPLTTIAGLALMVPACRRLAAKVWVWRRAGRWPHGPPAAGDAVAPGAGAYVGVVRVGGGWPASPDAVDGLKPVEGREVGSKPLDPPPEGHRGGR